MSAKASTAKEATEKHRHQVTNWPEYDAALVKRGSLTVWFEEDAVQKHWVPEATGKRGAAFHVFSLRSMPILCNSFDSISSTNISSQSQNGFVQVEGKHS